MILVVEALLCIDVQYQGNVGNWAESQPKVPLQHSTILTFDLLTMRIRQHDSEVRSFQQASNYMNHDNTIVH